MCLLCALQEHRRWHSFMHSHRQQRPALSQELAVMDNWQRVGVPVPWDPINYTRIGHGAAVAMILNLATSEWLQQKWEFCFCCLLSVECVSDTLLDLWTFHFIPHNTLDSPPSWTNYDSGATRTTNDKVRKIESETFQDNIWTAQNEQPSQECTNK